MMIDILIFLKTQYWILKYKGIFAYLFIGLLVPFIYGAVYEVNKLFFGTYSKKTFIFMLIGILILSILPNFTFITKVYYITPLTGSSGHLNPDATSNFFTIFTLFTMTLLIGFIILLIILKNFIVKIF